MTLPPGPPSRYRLRFEPHDGGLATIEAIARAFGILEGRHIEEALLAIFGAMVERTLWARGAIDASAVALGIPPGAERHDPDERRAPRTHRHMIKRRERSAWRSRSFLLMVARG